MLVLYNQNSFKQSLYKYNKKYFDMFAKHKLTIGAGLWQLVVFIEFQVLAITIKALTVVAILPSFNLIAMIIMMIANNSGKT